MDVFEELSQSLLNLNSGHSLPIVLQRILAEKTRELQALIEINRTIASSADREILFPRIAAETKTILALDGVVIRLVQDNELVRMAYAGSGDLARQRTQIVKGESVSGTVVHENRAVAIHDVSRDAALTGAYRKLLAKVGCRSMLGVPLRSGEEVIGAMIGLSERERDFQPDEIDLMSALADQAAIAAQKCALFEDAEAKSSEVKKTGAELEQAHRAKAKFMAAVSHELRTPLQVIIGSADLLKDGIVGRTKDEQNRFLSAIVHYAELLDGLIGNVLTVAKSDAKQTSVDVSTAEIEDVMGNILRYTSRINQNERLKFSRMAENGLPPITTDVAKLDEILKHLVGNACKFTLEGSIEVRVKNLSAERRFEFSVADSGIGIDERDQEKIFDEFYQARQSQPTSHGGIGLGLSIVKRYLSLLQGEIRLESQPGKGSTFTFTLPHSIPGDQRI
jgi:signal transduction histidine kinase